MTFFDATSVVFKNFSEYVKIFLIELLAGLIMGVAECIPFIGWMAVLIVGYYSCFVVPVGVHMVYNEGCVDFEKLIKETYQTCLHPGEALKQLLKMLIVAIVGCLLLGICLALCISGIMASGFGNGAASIASAGMAMMGFIIFLIIIVVMMLMLMKMEVTFNYQVLSQLEGDNQYYYLDTHRSLFTKINPRKLPHLCV